MKRLLPALLILAQASAQTLPASAPAQPQPTPEPQALAPVQIVMDDVGLRGSKFKIGSDDFYKPLVEMFQKAGFTVLPAKGALPADALQFRFMVAAVQDKYGRVAYQIAGRASQGRYAKLNENPAGQPQRVWFGNITGARSEFEAGVSEIHQVLGKFASDFYRLAAGPQARPVTFPIIELPAATRINAAEYQTMSQVKIKSDGYRPPWPREALERRTAGHVLVELLIGEDGKPVRAFIKSGPPELYLHAIQWAMGYEFEPALVDGKPVKSRFLFNMGYRQDDLERFSIR